MTTDVAAAADTPVLTRRLTNILREMDFDKYWATNSLIALSPLCPG